MIHDWAVIRQLGKESEWVCTICGKRTKTPAPCYGIPDRADVDERAKQELGFGLLGAYQTEDL